MVPWKAPEVSLVPGGRLAKRSTMKNPLAPANLPVPPVMVFNSVMKDIPVAVVVCIDNPLMSVKIRSPSVVINGPLPAAVVGVVVKITVKV